MTLRVKLFALMGGLLALMVGAEWLLVEALTRDLRVEVTAVATSVGRDVVKVLQRRDGKLVGLGGADAGVRRIVVHDEAHVVTLPPPAAADVPAKDRTAGPEAGPKEAEGPRFVVTTVRTEGSGTTSSTKTWTTKGGPASSSWRGRWRR